MNIVNTLLSIVLKQFSFTNDKQKLKFNQSNTRSFKSLIYDITKRSVQRINII